MFPTATVWSAERLRRDYANHLRSLPVQVLEAKRAHRKKLNQIGVCKQICEWYGELEMHRRIIFDQWKALQKQKMLSELEANNALTFD
ncbi:hypothetical protein niasHT_006688 [Heterodera trifolii]|uniref:Uncharacterized protein n=1 Tax=Heterodera trifolii TaxID=157864 RepID=A0ABD2IKU6_9BILA